MVIPEPERQRSYIALVGVKLGGSRFGSSRLEDGVPQEDLQEKISKKICVMFVSVKILFLDKM